MKKLILTLLVLGSSYVGAQTINCPNLPWGMTMEFDQVNDTVAVSNSGPWDFSSLQTVHYERGYPSTHQYTLPITQMLRMF